jgi:hypothetical protein
MTSLTALLSKWPLIRQIGERADGTGMEAMSDQPLPGAPCARAGGGHGLEGKIDSR